MRGGGMRALVHAVQLTVAVQLAVAGMEGLLDEGHRITQPRHGLLLEHRGHRLHGDLRRDLAPQVSAHAVGQHHQQRLAREAVPHPILVDRTTTDIGILENGKTHGSKAS